MRKRITFVHLPDSPFQPERLRVDNGTLRLESLKAAREERITFGYTELPQELWLVLKQCHELHIRWTTQRPYNSEAPFVSRVSPGLHAFFTPSRNKSADNLCPLLRKVFGDELRCQSPESTFIAPAVLSDRFASASSLQLYQPLPSLSSLLAYIQQKICAPRDPTCRQYTSALLSADYLDVDYDSISHALILNGFWSHAPSPAGWTENIRQDEGVTDKVEIGVLSQETSSDVEELKLGGFLTVVGEDIKPKPTLFSFPSRHHPLPSNPTFSTSFADPTGLHPVVHLTFPPSSLTPPPVPICFLHTYLTLPSALFADKYQLSDPLFLQSHNLRALRSVAGETDLEAPDWVVQRWGSTLLLELLPPPLGNDDEVFTVSVPLHLRYLPPRPSGHRQIEVPHPVVFWACRAEEGTKMAVNPFDRVNLGYEGIFGPKTMFYHLSPSPSTNKTRHMGAGIGSLVETLRVPVLNMDVDAGESTGGGLVEFGTVLAIVAGFLWVCWCLFRALRRSGESGKTRDTPAKQKKDK